MTDRPQLHTAGGIVDPYDRPDFATAMRGYDRHQVESYIDRLLVAVSDAEERARAVESELEFSRHTTVGPRVGQILELAVEEGKELRQRVRTEVDAMLEQARAEAEVTVAGALVTAELTRAEAEREGAEVLAEADDRRREVLAEIERLTERKTRLLGDLVRLQHLLAQATGVHVNGHTGNAPAGNGIAEGSLAVEDLV